MTTQRDSSLASLTEALIDTTSIWSSISEDWVSLGSLGMSDNFSLEQAANPMIDMTDKNEILHGLVIILILGLILYGSVR